MNPMFKSMLEHFQSVTPETLHTDANYKLTIRIIRGLAVRLNMTYSLAAQIAGKMKIDVNNAAYADDPDTFNQLADELVRILGILYDGMNDEFDTNTALAYVEAAAPSLSLTYG